MHQVGVVDGREPRVGHQSRAIARWMHAIFCPVLGWSITNGLIEHALERDEGGVVLVRDAAGSGAVLIELREPLVIDGTAAQHEWLADDDASSG